MKFTTAINTIMMFASYTATEARVGGKDYQIYIVNTCNNQVTVMSENRYKSMDFIGQSCQLWDPHGDNNTFLNYVTPSNQLASGTSNCQSMGGIDRDKCNLKDLPEDACFIVAPDNICDKTPPVSVTTKPSSAPTAAPISTPSKPTSGIPPRSLFLLNKSDRDQQAGILTGGGRSGTPIDSLLKKDIKPNSCVLVSDTFTAPLNSQLNDSFYYFTSEAYLPVGADPDLISPQLVDGDTCNQNSINMIMTGGECSGLSKMPENACVIVIDNKTPSEPVITKPTSTPTATAPDTMYCKVDSDCNNGQKCSSIGYCLH